MDQKWKFVLLILMTLIGLSSIAIILFLAHIFETILSIGAFIFAVFWFIWFKKTGWYLLSEELRSKIKKICHSTVKKN